MKILTPLKAIRAKCIDCSGGQYQEVRLCPVINCPLYAYRMGHRPKCWEIIEEDAGDEKSLAVKGFIE